MLGDVVEGTREMLYWTRFADDAALRRSVSDLRELQATEETLEDVVDTLYEFDGYGRYASIEPLQIRSELEDVTRFLADQEPEVILEIGTANGGTYYPWCRWIDSVELFVSVDIELEGMPHGFLDPMVPDVETKSIRQDSHEKETFEKAKEALDGRSVDFLHVDGDHSYSGIVSDFVMYKRLLADDGIVAFHDIVNSIPYPENHMPEFWAEIEPQYETREFVDESYGPDDPTHTAGVTMQGHGFGVVLDPRPGQVLR